MVKNIGKIDRVIRVIIGVICLIITWYLPTGWFKIILAIIGLLILFQAVIGWCGLYALLGKSTCSVNLKK